MKEAHSRRRKTLTEEHRIFHVYFVRSVNIHFEPLARARLRLANIPSEFEISAQQPLRVLWACGGSNV